VIHKTFIITGSDWASFEHVSIQITKITVGHGDPFDQSTNNVTARYFIPPPMTAVANAPGNWSYAGQLDEPGMYKITVVGQQSGLAASTTMQVLPALQPSSSAPTAAAVPMQTTAAGTNYLAIALIGSAIAATGAVLAVLIRSRRRGSSAA
jgi:hypothetical protein